VGLENHQALTASAMATHRLPHHLRLKWSPTAAPNPRAMIAAVSGIARDFRVGVRSPLWDLGNPVAEGHGTSGPEGCRRDPKQLHRCWRDSGKVVDGRGGLRMQRRVVARLIVATVTTLDASAACRDGC
jgi:hypothetical protein